jgi:hypothetical protein
MPHAILSPTLSDLPLWRLLVALHDAERAVGANSPTARTLAREIETRLQRGDHGDAPSKEIARAS